MASSTLLCLSILLGLLSISANARPCKTLFISSYSFTFKPHFPRNPSASASASAGGSLTVFTEIRQFNSKPFFDKTLRSPIPLRLVDPDVADFLQRPSPSGFFSSAAAFDSFRDRAKDVLSVVVALLFGVGCGALTAATMYLAWSLFSYRYEYRSSYDDFDDDDDVSPKKIGYVKIPADVSPVPAPGPAKEVEEQTQPQPHTHQEAFQIQRDQLQQRQQSNVPSPSFPKTDYTDSDTKFSASISSSSIQNMLGSLCPDGSGNLFNFSKTGQSMLNEQPPQQPWAPKFAHSQVNAFADSMSLPPYPGKDAVVEPENCSLDVQNHTLFGVNIDSSGLLLPTTMPSFGTSSIDADVSSMPLGASGFQSSLYGCMHDSSELLNGAGQVDPPTPTRTYVKVYKPGSVGRSLDITRFSSYNELREELGRMFGIEGKLEDPPRSGWQLVFVDRENDVLLLGDDPWEAFVNNVWYIKILTPEDVQTMGKQQGVESFSPNVGQRMSSTGSDARDLVSGLPSVGSLEY